MKKITILIIFFFPLFLRTQAQGYLISFAGTGATTSVETVKVDNLISGATITLNGGDILHLTGSAGISSPDINYGALQINPNPMAEQSTLTFVATENGHAVIRIVDLSGKTVYQTDALLSPGIHSFRVFGVSRGMYFVKVIGNSYFYSAKLISHGNQQSAAGIEYIASVYNPTGSMLKIAVSTIDMLYSDGDQLLFKGKSGIYSTIVPDVPTGNKTITFNFTACTDADNNQYSTVQISDQIWMAENLNVGNLINGIQEQTNNSTIEKYCYDNLESNCNIYGGLYQWNEMMQYVTTPGVKGICPIGWHIPTDGEWCTVTQFLDSTVNCEAVGWSGTNTGGKMKSTGTIQAGTGLWNTPNAGATNESGFTAVPAGYRISNGAFYFVGNYGYWWSSSESSTYDAWIRDVFYNASIVFRVASSKDKGFSVRCLRDF